MQDISCSFTSLQSYSFSYKVHARLRINSITCFCFHTSNGCKQVPEVPCNSPFDYKTHLWQTITVGWVDDLSFEHASRPHYEVCLILLVVFASSEKQQNDLIHISASVLNRQGHSPQRSFQSYFKPLLKARTPLAALWASTEGKVEKMSASCFFLCKTLHNQLGLFFCIEKSERLSKEERGGGRKNRKNK